MHYSTIIEDENKFFNLCYFWQDVLRLNDWDIEFIQVSDVSEFANEGNVYGECEADGSMKEAEIRIWFGDSVDKGFDMEHTIVHELLHIVLNDLDICACDHEIEERIINVLAKSLLRLKSGD